MTEAELKQWLGDGKPVSAGIIEGMKSIPVPKTPHMHILAWMTYVQLLREARGKDTA